MTAPTPAPSDLSVAINFLLEETDRTVKYWGSRTPMDIRTVIDALFAVTAERDQVREALAAENKLGAFETGKTIGAAEVRKELDQARQMLADAPHSDFCNQPDYPCRCWKAGL